MLEREMHGVRGNEAVAPPPPLPPEYPDLYGKRRELAKIQLLEREIGFLQEEVKSVEGHQPASRACKEVVDFVTCNADPLIPISSANKIRRSRCFWKWLCGLSCFNVSWICCSSNPEKPQCCGSPSCSCSNGIPCCSCSLCWNSQCFNKSKCSCMFNTCSCLTCSGKRHRCYPKVNMCSRCNKTSCYSCCFCY